jgi:hypothetical protein
MVSISTIRKQVGKITQSQREKHLLITPDQFYTIPCPTYPIIKLSVIAIQRLNNYGAVFLHNPIHIATEGPLGLAANKPAFTTSSAQPGTGQNTVRIISNAK